MMILAIVAGSVIALGLTIWIVVKWLEKELG